MENAQELCFAIGNDVVVYVGAVTTTIVSIASFLANFVSKDKLLGKIVHYLAINIKNPKVEK